MNRRGRLITGSGTARHRLCWHRRRHLADDSSLVAARFCVPQVASVHLTTEEPEFL